MRTKTAKHIVLAISQVLLCILVARECDAQPQSDSDYPSGAEANAAIVSFGNPLAQDDIVYGLRGTYRFVRGDLGLELGLHYAKPTSEFVQNLDAELFLFEFSVVWYANYRSWYRKAATRDPWHDNKTLKPEIIVFGGPGWGLLRTDDAFPNFPLPDASKDYLVLHAGVAAKIHWFQSDPERGKGRKTARLRGRDQKTSRLRGWDHKTSRLYVRPEVMGRWFAGDNGDVDLTVGVSLGTSFGHRPSQLALELTAREEERAARYFLAKELEPAIGEEPVRQAAELRTKAEAHLDYLEELKAYAVSCGSRCEDVRDPLEEVIEKLQDALSKL